MTKESMPTDSFFALLNRQEALLPELEDYLEHDGPLGPQIRHPLVYNILHHSNAWANELLRQKQRQLSEAVYKQDWHSYVWLHERPWRFDAFCEIAERIEADEDYWSLLGGIWTDSENIWQNYHGWREIFESPPRPHREHFMDEGDRRKARGLKGGLPKVFTVYRGFHDPGVVDGLSWTLDREQAIWFAKRLRPQGATAVLATGTLSRRDVIGYMTGRGEDEIVCLPEDVCGIALTEIEE